MNGILNVLKPQGMTSFDVVAYLRRIAGTKKVGHTGTLDPLAAGVLPVCIGNATKVIEYLVEKDKLYRAELTLGSTTDTQDSSGRIIDKKEVTVSDDYIISAIKSFEGRYAQIPPMYSALKIGGRKLYELAREGRTVEREPREVVIYSAETVIIERMDEVKVLFDIKCSKGTYIRTLCHDIGERLGCGGHMSFLLRLESGAFKLSESLTLEEIGELAAGGGLGSRLVPPDRALESFASVKVGIDEEKLLLNGRRIPMELKAGADPEIVRIYDHENRFLALGETIRSSEGMILRTVKFFR